MITLETGCTVAVLKGCKARGIIKYAQATVRKVEQVEGERQVKVVLAFGSRVIAFYAQHKNRLSDQCIGLNDGNPLNKIVVEVRKAPAPTVQLTPEEEAECAASIQRPRALDASKQIADARARMLAAKAAVKAAPVALSIVKVRIDPPAGATDARMDKALAVVEGTRLADRIAEFVRSELLGADGLEGFKVSAEYEV